MGQKPITAEMPMHILNAIPRQLFLYTDISEPVIVGDTRTSLLRIIPVNLKNYSFGMHQYQTFTSIKYVPLMNHDINTITIDIRDEMNEMIPFEFGTLIVTLHFRKIDEK